MSSETTDALVRAGRRVMVHLIRATIEGVKAIEAVIEEVGAIGEARDNPDAKKIRKIEIE